MTSSGHAAVCASSGARCPTAGGGRRDRALPRGWHDHRARMVLLAGPGCEPDGDVMGVGAFGAVDERDAGAANACRLDGLVTPRDRLGAGGRVKQPDTPAADGSAACAPSTRTDAPSSSAASWSAHTGEGFALAGP
jgi:hypothetical protein